MKPLYFMRRNMIIVFLANILSIPLIHLMTPDNFNEPPGYVIGILSVSIIIALLCLMLGFIAAFPLRRGYWLLVTFTIIPINYGLTTAYHVEETAGFCFMLFLTILIDLFCILLPSRSEK